MPHPQDQRLTTDFARWNVQDFRTKECHVSVEIIDGLERVIVAVVRSPSMQMEQTFRLAAVQTKIAREEHIPVSTFDPYHDRTRTVA